MRLLVRYIALHCLGFADGSLPLAAWGWLGLGCGGLSLRVGACTVSIGRWRLSVELRTRMTLKAKWLGLEHRANPLLAAGPVNIMFCTLCQRVQARVAAAAAIMIVWARSKLYKLHMIFWKYLHTLPIMIGPGCRSALSTGISSKSWAIKSSSRAQCPQRRRGHGPAAASSSD